MPLPAAAEMGIHTGNRIANDGPIQVSQITDQQPQQPPKAHVSLRDLVLALSGDRLEAYSSRRDDKDSTDAAARYLWNGALCIAFQPILHAIEVSLRNTIYTHSVPHVNWNGPWTSTIRCWLTAKPTMLFDRQQEDVDEALERLYKKHPNPKMHTDGRLIARLGFGFWTSLLYAPYDSGRAEGPKLWPVLTPKVFPHAPQAMQSRHAIATAFDEVREFRNRIAHHEPIWDRNPNRVFLTCYSLLSYMYPELARSTRVFADFQAVYRGGPGAFRPFAQTLLGV